MGAVIHKIWFYGINSFKANKKTVENQRFWAYVINGFQSVVRTERLELSHLSAPEPKSGASTNSATFAIPIKGKEKIIYSNNKKIKLGAQAGKNSKNPK